MCKPTPSRLGLINVKTSNMDIVRRRHCRKLLKKYLRVVTTALVNDILEFVDESNEEKRISRVREWIKRRTVPTYLGRIGKS